MSDFGHLSWNAVVARLKDTEASCAAKDGVIVSLRSELKAAQDSLAKLEAKPVFEVGKCYRRRDGSIAGPLEKNHDQWSKTHPLRFDRHSYRLDGLVAPNGTLDSEQDIDILPGPVDPPPTWTPPKSLVDGLYCFTPNSRRFAFASNACDSLSWVTYIPHKHYRDWTDPPREGRWNVTDGNATYLGE